MKNLLRIKAKALRNTLDCDIVSDLIVKQILNWDKFIKADNVMIYCPIKNEINLMGLTSCSDKNFYLPKIDSKDEICIKKFTSLEDCKQGKFNIPEPVCETVESEKKLDLIFMPSLSVDKWGYRLGYGKGYYDRFLEKLSVRTIKVIPQFTELFCEELPVEAHDKRTDFIILKDKIIDTRILIAENRV